MERKVAEFDVQRVERLVYRLSIATDGEELRDIAQAMADYLATAAETIAQETHDRAGVVEIINNLRRELKLTQEELEIPHYQEMN